MDKPLVQSSRTSVGTGEMHHHLGHQTRYVFAYGMDNSDRPSYLLWPIRGGNGQFLLVDPWSGNYFDLEAAKFVKPIGIEHFFDAFSLEKKRPLKVDAASALNIPVNEVSDLLVVSQDRAKRFELTPVWAPAEPPTKRAKTAEVRLSSASNVPMPPTNDDNEILEKAPYKSDTVVACRPVIVDIHNDQMQSYKLISRPRGAGAHHQNRERWEHGGGRSAETGNRNGVRCITSE